MFYLLKIFICTLLLLQIPSLAGAYETPEQRLLKAMDVWQQGNAKEAELLLDKLLIVEPEFRLAHLLRADILKSRVMAITRPAEGLEKSDQLEQLMLEARLRLQAQENFRFKNKIPSVLIQPDISSRYIFVIDLKVSRLFVFENKSGQPKYLHDYFISMGRGGADKQHEGDLHTPLGVYFIQRFLSPIKLDDKYGAGAYPLNYPNAWDKFNQRTGSGIWLHGTRSGTYNRPPFASEGCVVLPNTDLMEVGAYIDIGQTPVIIANGLSWLSVDEWQRQHDEYIIIVQNWLEDWQSMEVSRYLSHYSTAFNGDNRNYFDWAAHKRKISREKTFVKVEARNLSLFKHPNDDVLVVTFQQIYNSNDFSSNGWKRQYWHKEKDGHWRIIFEGKVGAPMLAEVQVD